MSRTPRVQRRSRSALNETRVSFMANSNLTIHDADEHREFAESMWDLQDQLYTDQEALEEVFGRYPEVDTVEDNGDFSVEVGKTMHRGHLHFSVTLKHRLPRYDLAKLRLRLKAWLDANWGPRQGGSAGWNVNATLMQGSQYVNYNNKEARYAANDALDELSEEVKRLSSDKELLEKRGVRAVVRVLEDSSAAAQRPETILKSGRIYNRQLRERVVE